jgi:hypothetical protein
MENVSISVRRDELRNLFECLLQRLNDEVELETDYYLTIPTDEWDQVEESPEPAIGSLHDDWHELRRILDEDRLFTAIDFDRVAAVLKAISEEVLT